LVEVLSTIPVITGCVLFRALALAACIGFPDWAIDAATVPLKVFISYLVTRVLYAVGYPIARNGVMIMIGSYEVLVKDLLGHEFNFCFICDRGVLCLRIPLGK
jgi:hypothetical protein